MNHIDPQSWKQDLPAFREKTAEFYAGGSTVGAYKGFSGYYGSYAQKGGKASMLRLRMPGGRVTPEKLAFVAHAIRDCGVKRAHFTTCQTIQLHDLDADTVCTLMEQALDAGIVTMGGGGDFPRNVMCSPLSGVQADEYFDVLPYAEAAGEYLMHFIKAEKMPRKLKVGFSSSPANQTHATYRDLGFTARPDGKFDVYSAGGLGNNPRFGVKVAEAVDPSRILYYIKAMWLTFRAYGNYENRGKARTRYMQEALGGAEQYKKAYLEKLDEVIASGEELTLDITPAPAAKTGDGTAAAGPRILPQKQDGLYTVVWHPIGGQPSMDSLCALSDALNRMEGAEMRLAPDETAYIINLTGAEAEAVIAATPDQRTKPVRDLGQLHRRPDLSGRPARLAGPARRVRQGRARGKPAGRRAAADPHLGLPVLVRHAPDRCARPARRDPSGGRQAPAGLPAVRGRLRPSGQRGHGRELGVLLEQDVPAFLVALGKAVAASGQDYAAWHAADPAAIDRIAAPYLG